ncbi:NRDE family protein [Myceligenerans indicum]|uniref:NRDE family protein n=1 Tax=Myceligenerans indicum TaxID=2593663 RepID=UPI00191F9A0E|nr:NRDE family protein [Myceligenerans indicum]
MCTVLLRLDPAADWPLLLAAVRDEVADRPWEPPGEYWPQEAPGLVGGRDLLAGGTWLAVRRGGPHGGGGAASSGAGSSGAGSSGAGPDGGMSGGVVSGGIVSGGVMSGGAMSGGAMFDGVAPAGARPAGGSGPGVAAVLNGSFMNRLDRSAPGSAPSSSRPSRGRLPLRALTSGVPDAGRLREYEVVHLLVADADGARLVSWDGQEVTDTAIPPGDHIVTNEGLDVADDPLVPHFAPLLAGAGIPGGTRLSPDGPSGTDLPGPTTDWWGDWTHLLRGDGLAEDDPRALLVRHELPDGRVFGSVSATLLALGREPGRVRMDFTGTPSNPEWKQVEV